MGGINPNIALATRAPDIQIQVPQPLQQMAQVLTLRDLMQRGQLGQIQTQSAQLELEQARQMMRERQALSGYLGGLTNPQPVAAAPTATDGTTTATATGAPATAATGATAATPATGGGLPEIDYGRIFQIAPNLGPAFLKNLHEIRKSAYEESEQGLKVQQAKIDAMATLASGATDDTTKVPVIAKAYQNGYIDQATRDHLLQTPYNADEWRNFQTQAETATQRIADIREQKRLDWEAQRQKHEAAMYPSQEQKATVETDVAQANRDASVLAAAAARSPDALQAELANLPPKRAGLFLDAKTPAEIMTRASNPEQYLANQRANEQILISAANAAREKQKFDMMYGPNTVESLVQQVYAHPDSAKDVPADMRAAVIGRFRQQFGIPFPTPLEGASLQQEGAAKSTQADIDWIRNALQNPNIAKNVGPLMGNIGNIEQALGTATGLTGADAQQAQEFRTRMRMMLANEAGAMRARINPKVMDDLASSSGRVNMDADMLKGALDGVEGYTKNKLDTFERQRFGGQMRPPSARNPAMAVPANVSEALKGASIGKHQLSDGSIWQVNADGSITPANAPK
jgi:hypothetical protein